ncbi:MAG TPA: carboxylesterase family protein, partial [Spirochaetia bacterium]|nr:carboxylesterase family protein [Spirochaetia bacterium]
IPESFMSEDCLYLNVHVPVRTDGKPLPVMVWLHGGGLTNQSGSRDIYNMPFLPAAGNVIQVSVVHRLGPIGYLAHPALSAESPQGVSGNYGNLDILAALKWVKDNIAAFGGDPGNVTLFGQSGGGTKTAMVVASPLAKGLVDKAIIMSGRVDGTPLKEAEKIGLALAEKLGVTGTGPEALAALRALKWQDIIVTSLQEKYSADHTIDGWALPDAVSAIFKDGKQNDIPLMMGFTESDIPDYAIQGVSTVVSQMKMLKSPVYPYMFTYLPKNWRKDGAKAWHSLDVGYIFGNPRKIAPVNFGDYGKRAGAVTPDAGFGPADDAMSEFMMQTWAQFARTGDPSLPGGLKWPSYSRDKDQYVALDTVPEIRTGYSAFAAK